MNIFDMDYNKKEKNLFKYHYTCLLSELLILNYEFSNHEYNGTTGQDAFYKLQKKIKYGMKLIDFEKMEFEKIIPFFILQNCKVGSTLFVV